MAISKLDSLYDQLDNTNLSSGATDIEDRSLMQNGDDITYTSGYINVNIGNTPSSEGDYLLHGLDVPITTTDFVLDFDYYRVSGGTNCFAGLVFRSNLSGESTENSTAGDYIRTSPNANGTSMDMYWHNDGDSSETAIGYLTGLNSAGNWNYLRLTRTNGTTIKLERFSSSARSGSADATVTATNLSATWGLSLKYIGGYCAHVGSSAGNGLHERFQNIDLSSTTKGKTAKQRVVETFSGLNLDTNRWNITKLVGSPTFPIKDIVNTGVGVTPNETNAHGLLNFNNKRQYNPYGSVFIAIGRHGVGSQQRAYWGLHGDILATWLHGAEWEQDWSQTYQRAVTNDGGTKSGTDMGTLANSETNAIVKGTLTASNFNITHNGISLVDKTTDLPTQKLQPVIGAVSTLGARGMYCQYMEAYNT